MQILTVKRNPRVVIFRSDVVRCLSDIMRNDTLLENHHRLSKTCRKQLRFELLQRVSLNTEMMANHAEEHVEIVGFEGS